MELDGKRNSGTEEKIFNIDDHFRALMTSIGLDAADIGGTVTFVGEDPIFESSIRLGTAYALPYMGTAAAAAMIWRMRTGRGQDLKIDLRKAIYYIADHPFSTLNGKRYPVPYADGCNMYFKLYRTKDDRWFTPAGFYPRHERQWYDFLGCTPNRNSIAAKIAEWNALDLETECNERGLVGGMARTVDEWLNTECGLQLAQTPVIEITKIGDSPPEPFTAQTSRPLSGLRVLCNTHEVAGSTVGKTLAEQGADVMQMSSPLTYFHDIIYLEAAVGMRQTYIDLKDPADRPKFDNLVRAADVFVENYRGACMARLDCSPQDLASQRPGLIYASLRGVTNHGAWANRGCFDPVAIPLTGLACQEGTPDAPKYPPYNLLNDTISGIFGALGVYAALIRRAREGGSYHVKISLCGCAIWIGGLGFLDKRRLRREGEQHRPIQPDMFEAETSLGFLRRHAPCVEFTETNGYWAEPVLRYRGSDKPQW